MNIRVTATGEEGQHTALFPQTSFSVGNPSTEWLLDNGCEEVVSIPYVPTPEEIEKQTISMLTSSVQNHLDIKAQEHNYDGILSACSYATSTNTQFAAEAQACVEWRDACWFACYVVMEAVQLGEREVPTSDELLEELPELVWP